MNCRACGGQTEPVFEMEPMPLAGTFLKNRQDALDEPQYPLEWRTCRVCGLVNVHPDVPGHLIYDNYSYRASDVPALVRHHAEFAKWLVERFPDTKTFLEIGGNDGVLLNQLPQAWRRFNIDPSDVALDAVGTGNGWMLSGEPWPMWPGATVDLITSSNAFAHFSQIDAGLTAVHDALAPGGHFVMEVHDLHATLSSGQWDTVYHEHAVEWCLHSLAAAGAMHGLYLIDAERLPLHGGLIRATFRQSAASRAWSPFHASFDFYPLRDAYATRRAPELPKGSVAYGAAARATVYLNQTKADVEYVIDGSPRRQWRYVPGVGIPIYPPEIFGDPPACLITAWNHAEDIKARHPEFDRWMTAW